MELAVKNVIKRYTKKTALDSFDFTFSEGVYGLLGPNGAGKSTLMKIITQNVSPTGGDVLLDGKSIFAMKEEYKKLLGYMPQQQSVYPFYTGRQFLYYMGLLKGENRKNLGEKIEDIAAKVNLSEVIDRKMGTYSGGMKQRILIAQTFLGDSRILIFDEPTAGLDPKERIHVRQLIHDNAEGKIIIVATHVVQDIEGIADCIILQKDGKVEKSGSPAGLVDMLGKDKAYSMEDVYMDIFGE